MDVTYSTLAFADAIHDFKNTAVSQLRNIQIGLPGLVLAVDRLISIFDIENTILDIFAARSNDIELLEFSTPARLHKLLSDGNAGFGLIGDANGANKIIELLEKGLKLYYIIRNRENLCDSANTPTHSHVTRGIILNDINEPEISYPAWSSELCMSSKFCSKYNFKLDYASSTTLVYKTSSSIFTIDMRFPTSNPNNRTNILRFITSATPENISIAFQRKRSGDWFQALSSLDVKRKYVVGDGTPAKLNGPIYFCTEDRVAAAYSIALGANTIFVKKNTGQYFLYKNHISIHTDTMCRNTFNAEHIEEYKRGLNSTISVFEIQSSMLLDELNLRTPETDVDILKYIGYIYNYVRLMHTIGNKILSNKSTLDRFILGEIETLSNDDRNNIYAMYSDGMFEIPKLLSQNIHAVAAFPSLPSLTPISTDGIVDASHIYIAGLLSAFKNVSSAVPYIKKCIDQILALSRPSEELRFHYEGVISEVDTHSGGFVKPKQIVVHNWQNVCNVYIAYLKTASEFGERYNVIEQNGNSFHACEDFVLCYDNIRRIVVNTGTMKEELNKLDILIKTLEKDLD